MAQKTARVTKNTLSEEISNLKDQNAYLVQKLDEATKELAASKTQFSVLSNVNDGNKVALEHLRYQVDSFREMNGSKNDEIRRLEGELAKTTRELGNAKADLQNTKDDNDDLEEQIKDLQARVENIMERSDGRMEGTLAALDLVLKLGNGQVHSVLDRLNESS